MSAATGITPPSAGKPISAGWGRNLTERVNGLRFKGDNKHIFVSQDTTGVNISFRGDVPRAQVAGTNQDFAPARITGGSAAAGYTVDLFANGYASGVTGTGKLYLPEAACDNSLDLPAGTPVLAHAVDVTLTGGG